MTLTGIAFLGMFFVGSLLAFVRHPIYGLMTYVAVFYLHPPSRWWGEGLPEWRWSLLAAAISLVALIAKKRSGREATLFSHKLMAGLVVFLIWVGVQTLWAMDQRMHLELLTILAKYALLVGLIYKCVDSEQNLRLFLWTHVLGCTYLGWIVLEQYIGGRFEGFGGPDINEANSGALQIVTGVLIAASLFLAGRLRDKLVLIGCIPLVVNALVATLSRSGFLAMAVGGIVYNLFTPSRFRKRVKVLSVLAVVMFLMLTNPVYWLRIASIKHVGEEIEGVDTGAGRLVVIEAQWNMFKEYPLGCGHRCTAVLSPHYLDDRHLAGTGDEKGRSSHNTFMTMLVEQGIPGAIFYVLMMVWVAKNLSLLRRRFRNQEGFLATVYPAVSGILVAIIVGDMFVDYLKLEVRMWFIAIVMVMLKLGETDQGIQRAVAIDRAHESVDVSRPRRARVQSQISGVLNGTVPGS